METIPAVVEILEQMRARVATGTNGGLYGDRAEALHDLEAALADPSPARVRLLLAPTANLHELAMETGWGSEFNELAAAAEGHLGIS